MNKKVPTSLAILIILIFTCIIGGFTIYQQYLLLEEIIGPAVIFSVPAAKTPAETPVAK